MGGARAAVSGRVAVGDVGRMKRNEGKDGGEVWSR
jgi:hypothetical protein